MALERLTQVTTIGIASSVSLSGNIGIGTTNPTSTLHVAGTVLVTGVSTLGTLQISSGIVTATTGIIKIGRASCRERV